jgi:hypothetical protein
MILSPLAPDTAWVTLSTSRRAVTADSVRVMPSPCASVLTHVPTLTCAAAGLVQPTAHRNTTLQMSRGPLRWRS